KPPRKGGVQALKNLDSAISYQTQAETPSSREEALGKTIPTDPGGSVLPIAREELTRTDDRHLLQLQCKVEQLRKIEPVLKDLYLELFDQGLKDEAEAVIVALVRLQVTLVAEKYRLNAA